MKITILTSVKKGNSLKGVQKTLAQVKCRKEDGKEDNSYSVLPKY